MDEVKLLMNERSVDILYISELWLLHCVPDHLVNINYYKIFRFDNERDWGACIYVRDDLSATVINLCVPKHAGVEDVWVTIQCHKLPSSIIGSMYSHPNTQSVVPHYIQDIQ